MAKLTSSLRDRIKEMLTEKMRNNMNNAELKLCQFYYDKLKKEIPEDVLKVFNSIPEKDRNTYFHTDTYISIDLCSFGIKKYKNRYIYLHKGQGFDFDFPNKGIIIHKNTFLLHGKDKELATKYMNSYLESMEFFIDMDRKIGCALDSITNESQLKEEFPEAYDVYINKIKGKKASVVANKCDAIEEVRALLSKTK